MSGFSLEIEAKDLERVGLELGATAKQIKFAISRAARRTAASLRQRSERGIKKELDLRSVLFIRRRLKSVRIKQGKGNTFGLWYGLNDMPIPEFKGTPKETGNGANFRTLNVKGGFVAKDKKGRKTIFQRREKSRLPLDEKLMPVKDRLDVYIEDNIFDEVEALFFKNFEQDLQARVRLGVGMKDYKK